MNLGQGAHSALPIWGIWMQKVLKDGRLGVSENDVFLLSGARLGELNCTGGDIDMNARAESENTEEDFFN